VTYYTPDWLIKAIAELTAQARPCQCWRCRLRRWVRGMRRK